MGWQHTNIYVVAYVVVINVYVYGHAQGWWHGLVGLMLMNSYNADVARHAAMTRALNPHSLVAVVLIFVGNPRQNLERGQDAVLVVGWEMLGSHTRIASGITSVFET